MIKLNMNGVEKEFNSETELRAFLDNSIKYKYQDLSYSSKEELLKMFELSTKDYKLLFEYETMEELEEIMERRKILNE
jgi:hypothetical protein